MASNATQQSTSNFKEGIQKCLDRLAKWVDRNFIEFINSKCKVLHWNSSSQALTGYNTALKERSWGISVNNKWNICVPLWQRWGNYILGYIKSVEGIQHSPLFDVSETVFENKVTIQTTQYKKDIDILKQGWWRPPVWREGWSTWHMRRGWEKLFSLKKRNLKRTLIAGFSYKHESTADMSQALCSDEQQKKEKAMVTNCNKGNSELTVEKSFSKWR